MRTAGQEIALLNARLAEAREELAEYRRREEGGRLEDPPHTRDRIEAVRRWFALSANEAFTLMLLIERSPKVVTHERIMASRPQARKTAEATEADPRANVAVMLHHIRRRLAAQGVDDAIVCSRGTGHYIPREMGDILRGHVEQAVAAQGPASS